MWAFKGLAGIIPVGDVSGQEEVVHVFSSAVVEQELGMEDVSGVLPVDLVDCFWCPLESLFDILLILRCSICSLKIGAILGCTCVLGYGEVGPSVSWKGGVVGSLGQ